VDKKVEKYNWDRYSCCVLPSLFKSHISDLALDAAEVESAWLAGDIK